MKFHFTRGLLVLLFVLNCQLRAVANDVTVAAASSLTNAFKEMGAAFEAHKSGTKVHFNFGASGALLQQLSAGAPVDVFASADNETMNKAAENELVLPNETKNFALNELVLIVPFLSALPFQGLSALTQEAVKRIAIGNPATVPAGRYTRRALEQAKLWTPLQSRMITTQNVRQSLDYVARAEVDAGFVYSTDALLMKDKVKVAMTVPLDTRVEYPISVIKNSKNLAVAKDFMRFVLSSEGRSILAKHGFGTP